MPPKQGGRGHFQAERDDEAERQETRPGCPMGPSPGWFVRMTTTAAPEKALTCPTVSVIVPTSDRTTFLEGALASIRALEGPDLRLQVIVADNGRAEDARPLVEAAGASYFAVSSPGASNARNAGLAHATGEFVAFLDDDDVWLPTHLRPHLERLLADPGLGAVVGQVCTADMDLRDRSAPWPSTAESPDNMFRHFLRCYPQIGATVVRRAVAQSIGPFDPSLIGDEDWDWHLRLSAHTHIGFVPVPSMLFRQRDSGRADTEWLRMPYLRLVLVRNLRAAPASPTLWAAAAVAFFHHRGAYAASFVRHADHDVRARHFRQAARNVGRAFVASPPHCVKALITSGLGRRRHVPAPELESPPTTMKEQP